QISVQKKAWVSVLELDIQSQQSIKKPAEQWFALLGGPAIRDGVTELNRVGRCLEWLYPDELDRVICRDWEVAELTRLLTASDKRPVMLMGPRLVGKTAIIHEFVYQRAEKKRSQYTSQQNVWLLSPSRLISGMSYVGQWENRLLAIIEAAKERKHILYFDDLLGLFQAGITRDSTLSVAHVLKPYIEKREFRMLAEITPEAWRVFQERDRGFADLFHIIPIREPGENEILRMLISLARRLEYQHRCSFDLDVLPTIIDIHRRYVRDAAFPGKAAAFLNKLAVKYRYGKISRANVLTEFQAKSGLSVSFLDRSAKLERKEVLDALAKEVIGQDAALQATADLVCIAKARLNDPDRPLASLFFLGPTGVGKTQCAKSLAAYLFGDAERILRFDMNEFISPTAVARLVGTFDNPEGLLTSAVRRQPFSVVLLDEIEKAYRDVFDLLLQVMGDGRLTDALGRTVDFTNTILIMTSNLGVKEANTRLGFQQDEVQQAHLYLQAAEKFFRPEFFNRLDRIIPFERLHREEIQKIANRLIHDIFAREGLLRRRCILQVDSEAMQRIIEQGYHPQLGARAMKRAIERQLTQPVAIRLAAMTPETPTVISLYPSVEGIGVHVEGLSEAKLEKRVWHTASTIDSKLLLTQVESAIIAVEERAMRLRPVGAINPAALTAEHYCYFVIQEQLRRVRSISQRLSERLAKPKRAAVPASLAFRTKARSITARQLKNGRERNERVLWNEIIAAQDIHAYLTELAADDANYQDEWEAQLSNLMRELTLLQTLAASGKTTTTKQVLIYVHTLNEIRQAEREMLVGRYQQLFGSQLILETTVINEGAETLGKSADLLLVKGLHALPLVRIEEGTHLFFIAHDNFVPVQVNVLPLDDQEDPLTRLKTYLEARRHGRQQPAYGKTVIEEQPLRLLPVIRIYDQQGITLDLRSGIITTRLPSVGDMRTFLLAALPMDGDIRTN
ncbi:MAG: AAA family ATPase, partial [Acidobacteriota bacterium]